MDNDVSVTVSLIMETELFLIFEATYLCASYYLVNYILQTIL